MAHELCMAWDGDEDRCSQTMPCPRHGAHARSTAADSQPSNFHALTLAVEGITKRLRQVQQQVVAQSAGCMTDDDRSYLGSICGVLDSAENLTHLAATRLRLMAKDNDAAVAADGRA
jgi:hypothetical protein